MRLIAVLLSCTLCAAYAQGQSAATVDSARNAQVFWPFQAGEHQHENGRICGFPAPANERQREALKAFESMVQRKTLQKRQAVRTKNAQEEEVYTIPVIVHIVHNGEDVGEGANISAAQVYSQIEVLNEDFRRANPDVEEAQAAFRDLAGDARIEFAPALVGPEGNELAEPGIHRYDGGEEGWGNPNVASDVQDIETDLKPVTIWDPDRYFNIWTVRFNNSNVLGYSLLADSEDTDLLGLPSVPASNDGIVIGFQYFGSIEKVNTPQLQNLAGNFNLGRTTTHEMAHSLGLHHLWGPGSPTCSADDYVEDTPNSSSTYINSCPEGTRISCGTADNYENFMNYVFDDCMHMFTAGQIERMRIVLENAPRRRQLLESTVHLESKVIAGFRADKTELCPGGSVRFLQDVSVQGNEQAVEYEWAFPGGFPATSTEQNPVVSYTEEGSYAVTLTVTGLSSQDVIVQEGYIVVSDFTALPPPSIAEGFEGATFPPADWTRFGAETGWQETTLGFNSLRSALIDFSELDAGESRLLRLPLVNASQAEGVRLRFRTAYALASVENGFDSLAVVYRDACEGFGYDTAWVRGGDGLAVSVVDPSFQPGTESDWQTHEVYIENVPYDFLEVAFLAKSDEGALLFLDNVEVEPVAGVLAEFSVASESFFGETVACAGVPVQFADESFSFGGAPITAWQWTFEGGTPGTSNAPDPLIAFDTPGEYDIALTVTREDGETDTRTVADGVSVVNFAGAVAELDQGFESQTGAFPPLGWTLTGNEGAWQPASSGGFGQSVFSARAVNYRNQVNAAAPGRLVSPSISLAGQQKPHLELSFEVAHGQRFGVNDSLVVLYTTDCGQTFEELYRLGGSALATANLTNEPFVPDASEWRAEKQYLVDAADFESVQFAFESRTAGGNDILVDNVRTKPVNDVVAGFVAERQSLCTGESTGFAEQTARIAAEVSAFEWAFEGGTPAVSDQAFPTVIYETPGVYDVRLVVTSSTGARDTLLVEDYVTVTDFVGELPELREDFENSGFDFRGWTVDETGWEVTLGGAFGEDGFSAFVDNFNENYVGERARLLTPIIDTREVEFYSVNFDYAYALNSNLNAQDNLRLVYTTDCWATETVIWQRTGEGLATADPSALDFEPTAEDWQSVTAYVTQLQNVDAIQFAFVYSGGFGNNLYLDNVFIEESPGVIAGFLLLDDTECADKPVQFINQSFSLRLDQAVEEWLWTFEGGQPETATNRNPFVTYERPGVYDVSLVVVSGEDTDTLMREEFIEIVAFEGDFFGETENFETEAFEINWESSATAPEDDWRRLSPGGYGESPTAATIFTDRTVNLLSPVVKAEGKENLEISFDYAYALPDGSSRQDALTVLYTTDCGDSEQAVWQRSSVSLATTDPVQELFRPYYDQWRTASIRLEEVNADEDFENLQVIFRFQGGEGNRLWIDNVAIETYNDEAPEIEFAHTVPFFPNATDTVFSGQRVQFLDRSEKRPSAFEWQFSGTAPGSSTLTDPEVAYTQSGRHAVTLSASNEVGADALTKQDYITVLRPLDTVEIRNTSLQTRVPESFGWGFLTGHNARGDLAKAEYFGNLGDLNEVVGIRLGLAQVHAGASPGNLTVQLWDVNADGSPGTSLAQQALPIGGLAEALQASGDSLVTVRFEPSVEVDGEFFAGVSLSYAEGDTVGLLTDRVGNVPTTGWTQDANGAWSDYRTAYDEPLAHRLYPLMQGAATTALPAPGGWAEALRMFPNPASERVRIVSDSVRIERVVFYDLAGRVVFARQAEGADLEVDVSELSGGLYAVRLETALGHAVRKLFVTH